MIKISAISVLYEDDMFGKGVRLFTYMEYKCYRMLKVIHGKDYADNSIVNLIISEIYGDLEAEFSHNPNATSLMDSSI